MEFQVSLVESPYVLQHRFFHEGYSLHLHFSTYKSVRKRSISVFIKKSDFPLWEA